MMRQLTINTWLVVLLVTARKLGGWLDILNGTL